MDWLDDGGIETLRCPCWRLKEPKSGDANGAETRVRPVFLPFDLLGPSLKFNARFRDIVASAPELGLRVTTGRSTGFSSFLMIATASFLSLRGFSRKTTPSSRAFLINSIASVAIRALVSRP